MTISIELTQALNDLINCSGLEGFLSALKKLQAIVNCAESQESTTFESWLFDQDIDNSNKIDLSEKAWNESKQIERERIREIIRNCFSSETKDFVKAYHSILDRI